MSAEQTVTASHGRTLAFRILAGLFGAIAILSNVAFSISVFTDDTEKVHSFHDLGAFPSYVFLIGFAMVVLAIRPTDVVALRVAWAAALGTTIAGLIGQDLVSGSYVVAPILLIVLTILAPTRRELLHLGRPNIALLSLAIIAGIPVIVYAWDNARMMLQGDPMTDVTGHWSGHHWSGIAGAALGLVLSAAVVAFRTRGRPDVDVDRRSVGDGVRPGRPPLRRRCALSELDRDVVGRAGAVRRSRLHRGRGDQRPCRGFADRGGHVSSRPLVKPPKGLRRLERWAVGIAMSIVAFFLERILTRSVKKKAPDPVPTTLTSKGGEVDYDG